MVIRVAFLLLLVCGAARAETLRLVVPDVHPVVGEMIPLTVRGEYTRRITLETLTFPDSDGYDWMQLNRDQWRDERVDGRAVKVFERRIALFPRRAGPVTVGPLTHRLTVAAAGGGREVLDVKAEPVTIQVAPFPADGTPLAASSLEVEDDLSTPPDQLRDGETLVRRVTLRAGGALPHLLPARPVMRQPWLISFTAPEVREMKPTPYGPETTIVWEWHLRPKTGEPGVLPAVGIPWFDTATRQMRHAEIPAIPFGYASFAGNRAGADRLPPAQTATGFAVFGTGLLTGLLLVFAGASRRRGSELLLTFKRWSPIDPTRREVRRAGKANDLMALRAATERYLARRRAVDLAEPEGATVDLDRAIYAKAASPGSFDPDRFQRALLSGRKSRAKSPR